MRRSAAAFMYAGQKVWPGAFTPGTALLTYELTTEDLDVQLQSIPEASEAAQLCAQLKFTRAKTLVQRARDVCEGVMGKEHEFSKASRAWSAAVHGSCGDLSATTRILEDCARYGAPAHIPWESDIVWGSVQARWCATIGEIDDALRHIDRCARVGDEADLDAAVACTSLRSVLLAMSHRDSDAADAATKSLSFTGCSPLTSARALRNAGAVRWLCFGDASGALEAWDEALDAVGQVDPPNTACTVERAELLCNKASVAAQAKLDSVDKAALLNEALKLHKECMHAHDVRVARAVSLLAAEMWANRQVVLAEGLLRGALLKYEAYSYLPPAYRREQYQALKLYRTLLATFDRRKKEVSQVDDQLAKLPPSEADDRVSAMFCL